MIFLRFARNLSFIIVSLLLFTSCSQHLGNFSALATGTYAPEKIKNENVVAKNSEGEACCLVLLGVPVCYPKVDEAVSKATAKYDGDFIMNGRLYFKTWNAILFGQICYKVEGDILKTMK